LYSIRRDEYIVPEKFHFSGTIYSSLLMGWGKEISAEGAREVGKKGIDSARCLV